MNPDEPAAGAGELVRCERLSVQYGSAHAAVRALDGIDLSIRPGERLVLRGPSGSGKTTLLHMLAGYLAPTSGRLWWIQPARTSMVFQGANLLPTFTAFENVAFAAHVAEAGGAEGHSPEELVALVGLGTKLDALPAELSGGESQRVAIARALAQAPALLLCDEPTGHLDSDTGRRVLDLIDALHERIGFALVMATHDAEIAARFPRSVELADGRITEVHEQVHAR